VGPVTYGQEDEPIFLGKEIARHKDYSEDTAKSIDQSIKQILQKALDCAREILESHKAELEKLGDALLLRETLVDEEVRTLLGLPPKEAALAALVT
jgi:cell division protease FtsH